MAFNKTLALKIDRDKLRQFFGDKKNRTYLILGGVLLLAAAVTVAFALNMGGLAGSDKKTAAAGTPPAGNTASVLPETTRTQKDSAQDPAGALGSEKVIDPFAGPMTLKGLMLGGGASDLAIIEVGDTTFVAAKGTVIADTWTVSEITSKEVILTTATDKIRLEFNGRSKTESTTPENIPQTNQQAPVPNSQAGGETGQ